MSTKRGPRHKARVFDGSPDDPANGRNLSAISNRREYASILDTRPRFRIAASAGQALVIPDLACAPRETPTLEIAVKLTQQT